MVSGPGDSARVSQMDGAVYGVYDGCDPNQHDEIDFLFPDFFFASQMSTRGCRSGSRGGADPQRGSLPPPPFREVALLTFSVAKVQLLSFCAFQPPPDTGITQHWQN